MSLTPDQVKQNGFLSEFIWPNRSLQIGPRRLLFYLILSTYIATGIYGAANFSPESRCQFWISLFLILNLALFIFLLMVWSFVPSLGFGLFLANFIGMSAWGIEILITELRTWKQLGLSEAGGYYCNYTSIGLAFLMTCLNCGFLLLLTTIALIQMTSPGMLQYRNLDMHQGPGHDWKQCDTCKLAAILKNEDNYLVCAEKKAKQLGQTNVGERSC